MIDNAMLQLAVRMQTLMAGARDRDRGATAVEYGLMLAAIVAVVGGLVWGLSDSVKQFFTDASTNIKHP
jgi:pilus assembly protein Flp/PilA